MDNFIPEEKKLGDKIFKWVSWTAIGIAFLILGLILYWLLIPITPIKFNYDSDKSEIKILNENKTVKGGEYLILFLDFCKYSTEVPNVSTYYVDGVIYETPQAPASSKDIGCQTLNLQLYVPKALPPGKYTVKRTYQYHPNPLRKIDILLETESFTITK